MTTPYSDIISLSRGAIGDFGVRDAQGDVEANSQDFADDDISTVIDLSLLKFPDISGTAGEISPTLNDNSKGALAYCVALALALPGGTYSMDSPNLKYWTQSNKELISHLLGQMQYYLEEGDVSPSIWGSLDLAFNECQVLAARATEIGADFP
jgi:hypothetical protein